MLPTFHCTHVQGKRHTGVGEEDKDADAVERVEGLKALDEGHDDGVDDSADGGVVVERHDGVHLHAVEEDLDHDKTRRLKDDSGALADEAHELKVELTVGSCGLSVSCRIAQRGFVCGTWPLNARANGTVCLCTCHNADSDPTRSETLRASFGKPFPRIHKGPGRPILVLRTKSTADGDHADDGQETARGLLELEGKRDEENGDGVEGLEHLDERDREAEVGVVGKDERAREESTDGEDGADPALAGHLNVLGAVDEGRGALEHTGGDGREREMEGGEEDGEGEVEVGKDIFWRTSGCLFVGKQLTHCCRE